MSGKLFWKQPLKGVVKNDVLKALKVLEARNLIYQNTFLQLLLVFLASATLYQIYVSNTLRRLIFEEINFRDVSFCVDLFSRMQILPYFAWIYFRGKKNMANFAETNFRENR